MAKKQKKSLCRRETVSIYLVGNTHLHIIHRHFVYFVVWFFYGKVWNKL